MDCLRQPDHRIGQPPRTSFDLAHDPITGRPDISIRRSVHLGTLDIDALTFAVRTLLADQTSDSLANSR